MKIIEEDLFSQYEGKIINSEHRVCIAESNGTGYGDLADCKEYIVYLLDLCQREEFVEKFGITPRLMDAWFCNGIDFRVYLYIKDDILKCGFVRKFKECCCGHFGESVSELCASQQELRIARRVLDYCIEK